jgi:hypothetical protein
VQLKLPKEYKYSGNSGSFDAFVQHSYSVDDFTFVSVNFYPNGTPELKYKYTAPNDAESYQRCADTINGHAASLQTYRAHDRNSGSTKFKIYELQADLVTTDGTVQIVSRATELRGQEEQLAAIRTVEFIPRSPRPAPTPRNPISDSEARRWQIAHVLSSLAIPLTGYFVIVLAGGYLLFRRKARVPSISNPKRRALIAVYFALVLAPGMYDDYLLFESTAPALFSLFTFWPAFFYVDLEGWPQLSATGLRIWAGPVFVTDVIWILIGFGIVYGVLTIYVRIRAWRKASTD